MLLQIAAALLVYGSLRISGFAVHGALAAILCGTSAMTLGYMAGLERWWLPIQLVFVPALWLMLTLSIHPAVYGGIFSVLLLVYWSTFRTRVPLYLSNIETWRAIEALLPASTADRHLRFIDLGCGLGGLLAYLAARRPHDHFVGVELAPLPALISALRLARYPNCSVHWRSLWNVDLAEKDVAFAFLSPVPMSALWEKAVAEMRPGALFVSSSFGVPGQTPDRIVEVEDARRTQLLIWRMPEFAGNSLPH
jgi:SAM-dependent methyltransferase